MSVTDPAQRSDFGGSRMLKPDSWVHHVLDMDGGIGVRTAVHNRPLGLTDRARAVKDVVRTRSRMTPESAADAAAARS